MSERLGQSCNPGKRWQWPKPRQWGDWATNILERAVAFLVIFGIEEVRDSGLLAVGPGKWWCCFLRFTYGRKTRFAGAG